MKLFNRGTTHIKKRLAYGGEWRLEVGCFGHIVITNNGQIVWHAQTSLTRGLECAQGHLIVANKNSVHIRALL